MVNNNTGWWCNVPILKNIGVGFVNGKDDVPYMTWKIKFMFETTNQNSLRNFRKLEAIRGFTEVATSWGLQKLNMDVSAGEMTNYCLAADIYQQQLGVQRTEFWHLDFSNVISRYIKMESFPKKSAIKITSKSHGISQPSVTPILPLKNTDFWTSPDLSATAQTSYAQTPCRSASRFWDLNMWTWTAWVKIIQYPNSWGMSTPECHWLKFAIFYWIWHIVLKSIDCLRYIPKTSHNRCGILWLILLFTIAGWMNRTVMISYPSIQCRDPTVIYFEINCSPI